MFSSTFLFLTVILDPVEKRVCDVSIVELGYISLAPFYE